MREGPQAWIAVNMMPSVETEMAEKPSEKSPGVPSSRGANFHGQLVTFSSEISEPPPRKMSCAQRFVVLAARFCMPPGGSCFGLWPSFHVARLANLRTCAYYFSTVLWIVVLILLSQIFHLTSGVVTAFSPIILFMVLFVVLEVLRNWAPSKHAAFCRVAAPGNAVLTNWISLMFFVFVSWEGLRTLVSRPPLVFSLAHDHRLRWSFPLTAQRSNPSLM